jgi:hypothetical protein
MRQVTQQRRETERGRKAGAVVPKAAFLLDQPARQGVRIVLIRDGQIIDPPEMREVKAVELNRFAVAEDAVFSDPTVTWLPRLLPNPRRRSSDRF